MLIGYFFYGVSEALKRHQKSRILQSPLGVQIRQYEEAIAAYEDAVKEAERKRLEIQREAEYARQAAERARQAADRAERRKRIDHWQAVRGIQFERELAALYRHLGYDVQSTPKSGDQGIDLILRKGGSTTIVQCKGQKGPASPAVVRELYGSFAAFQGAQHAILACNGGFTQGVYEFAIGKPNSPHLSKRDSPHGRRLFTTSTRASVDAEKPCAKTVNRPEMSSLWASDDLVRQILAVLRIPQL